MNGIVKPPLVDQPTSKPSRKIWAVIVSGMIVAAIRGGLNAACEAKISLACSVPDLGGAADGIVYSFVAGFADLGIGAAVISAAGYFTRNRAK